MNKSESASSRRTKSISTESDLPHIPSPLSFLNAEAAVIHDIHQQFESEFNSSEASHVYHPPKLNASTLIAASTALEAAFNEIVQKATVRTANARAATFDSNQRMTKAVQERAEAEQKMRILAEGVRKLQGKITLARNERDAALLEKRQLENAREHISEV
jgi:hypothetical protein